METKRHPVNLKQYRKVNGKWQFVPVARDAGGDPDPLLILLNGQSVNSKGGAFYLDYKEKGGKAREAWRTKLALLTRQIESDPETDGAPNAGPTIDEAIASFPTGVEPTKGIRTFRQYHAELDWFRRKCRKHWVCELDRGGAMWLFVVGRKRS